MVFGGTRRRGLDLTPMSEDDSMFQARGRKARREGGGNQDNPQDEQHIRSVLEYDEKLERVLFGIPPSVGGENSPPNDVRRVIKQPRRGAGNRSARVLILTKHRCQGRENFSGLYP